MVGFLIFTSRVIYLRVCVYLNICTIFLVLHLLYCGKLYQFVYLYCSCCSCIILQAYNRIQKIEATRGAGAQACDYKHDRLWHVCTFPTRGNEIINILISWRIAALSSATQHAMPPEFGDKWRAPTMLAGYSVKLKKSNYRLF